MYPVLQAPQRLTPKYAAVVLPAARRVDIPLLTGNQMWTCRQELAAAVVGEGLRPLPPTGLPADLQKLLDSCWAAEPKQRPSFDQLAAELRRIQVCPTRGAVSYNDAQRSGGAP